MIGAVVRWFRVVLPAGWIVATTVACYVALVVCCWCLYVISGRDLLAAAAIGMLLLDFVSIAATVYALSRIYRFHPLYSRAYREWLQSTPWCPGRRLPLGPIHLVPQDALVFAMLFLPLFATWPVPLPSTTLLHSILLPYLLFSMLTLFACRENVAAYAIAFAFPLVDLPGLGWGVLAVMTVISQIGLVRSIRTFPWPWEEGFVAATRRLLAARKEGGNQALGWPYEGRSPKPHLFRMPRHDAILLSLLAGWYAYLIFSDMSEVATDKNWTLPLLCFFVVFLAAMVRLLIYCTQTSAPISILGRFSTGRWIIPAYDQVFVAPLASLATMLVLPRLLYALRVSSVIAVPLSVVVALLFLLLLGPRLTHWRLTGLYRQVPGRLNSRA